MVNVPRKTMELLSLCTGATIVSSIDHASNEVIGYCQNFKISQNKESRRNAPLAFFSGCNPANGCTICLRGNSVVSSVRSATELCRSKRGLLWAIRLAYLLKEESWFVSEMSVTVPSVSVSPGSSFPAQTQLPFAKMGRRRRKLRFGELRGKPAAHRVPLYEWLRWSSSSPGYKNLSLSELVVRSVSPANEKRLVVATLKNMCELVNRSYSKRVMGLGSFAYWTSQQGGPCCKPVPYMLSIFGKEDLSMLGFLLKHFSLRESRKCPAGNSQCRAGPERHQLVIEHLNRRVIICVSRKGDDAKKVLRDSDSGPKIESWRKCKICNSNGILQRSPLSDALGKFSFGKFIELMMFDELYRCGLNCDHLVFRDHNHHFCCRSLVRLVSVTLKVLPNPQEIEVSHEWIVSYATGASQYELALNYVPPEGCQTRHILSASISPSPLCELLRSDHGHLRPYVECVNVLIKLLSALRELVKAISDLIVSTAALNSRISRSLQRMCHFRGQLFAQRNGIHEMLGERVTLPAKGYNTTHDILWVSTQTKQFYRQFSNSFLELERLFCSENERESDLSPGGTPNQGNGRQPSIHPTPRGRSLDREQVAIMQTRQEPKRVRSLNNVQGERQTASQLDNSPLSSQTLSKLCCERSRTIFSSCLAKLPNWHIGLPNGVFQIQVAVNEADVCSILAYAFSTHQLYSQMAVGWERLNGNPNCPLAASDEPSNQNTPGPDREPNLCVRTQFCMPSNMANVNPTSDEHQSEKNEIAKELPRAIKGMGEQKYATRSCHAYLFVAFLPVAN
eukprot:GHVN01019563.1.p1 GENE.GHVN01019563.1~~GHVN01019563.1.p1  ORF type:complete len:791 (-),score=34.18 GHVN01019563.1:1386-3758(-)